MTSLCMICGFEVSAEVDSYIVDSAFFGVNMAVTRIPKHEDLRVVHLACWQIRQLVPGIGDRGVNARGARGSHDSLDAEFIQMATCSVCSGAIGTNQVMPRVRLMNIVRQKSPHSMHFGCYCMAYNPRTKLHVGGESDREAALLQWMRMNPFPPEYRLAMAPPSETPNVYYVDVPMETILNEHKKTMSGVDGIRKDFLRMSFVKNVLDAHIFHAKKVDGATPAQRLYGELISKPRGDSPLALMHQCGFNGGDMISLGLTAEMILYTGSSSDWDILLNKDVFKSSDLVRNAINLSFTNMLYRGLDIHRFSSNRYLLHDLRTLRFSAIAFYAAAGNEDDYKALKTGAGCDNIDMKVFGFEK